MEFSAKQIAEFLHGTIEGDENIKVSKVCKIENGEQNGLSFLANTKYEHYIYDTHASIVIVNENFNLERPVNATLIRVKDAYSAFATLLELYNQYRFNRTGISSLAFIDESVSMGQECYVGEYAVIEKNVTIGDNCRIYPQVYIGENVKVGNNVTLYPGVKLYYDVEVGNNCILHAGAVIGADGFGFAPLSDGSFKKIPQTGNVKLGDNVEIGANACVDRSTMGSTVLKEGVKIDNLCQIGHNVIIDHDTVMSAQTGVAGSTEIGSNCFIGGQSGFAGHFKVGNGVKLAAKTGLISDVPDGATLMGYPGFNARDFMRSYVLIRKLPELEKRIRELEKQSDTRNK